MPDVSQKLFGDFDRKVSYYYKIEKLDPGYEVYFDQMESIKIGDTLEKIYVRFTNTSLTKENKRTNRLVHCF